MNFVRCLEHTRWPSFESFVCKKVVLSHMLYFISFWWGFCEILNCFAQMHDSRTLEGGSSVLEGKGSGHFPAKITHETVGWVSGLVEILWTESTSVYGVRWKQMSGSSSPEPWHVRASAQSLCKNMMGNAKMPPSPLNWGVDRFTGWTHFKTALTNLDGVLKSRDVSLPAKVPPVKAMVFPVVMYRSENWTIK